MRKPFNWISRWIAATAFVFCGLPEAQAQNPMAITLISTTSPTAGEPGVTNLSVTGSNFPTGTIPPANVAIDLKAASGGSTVTALATAVTTITGTTRRVSFTIPISLTVSAPTAYTVSLAGTTSTGTAFISSNSATLTINPAAGIATVSPNSGAPSQTLSVSIAGSYSNWLQGSTVANFGNGITVNSTTVTNATHATANITIAPGASGGSQTVTMTTGTEVAMLAGGFSVTGAAPTISSFSPNTGPIGALVTIAGGNFGTTPQISMNKLGGGTLSPPPSSIANSSLSFVVPAGAATGPIKVVNPYGNVTSQASFTVTPSTGFTLSVAPASANLIQGQMVSYSVSLASTNGFNQLAQLSVSGIPSGVTASFKPTNITAGQISVLTLTAPAGQPIATSNLSISAAATVDGLPVTQNAPTGLSVVAPTTTLLGRTVVANSAETPLAGVTITTLGKDGNGNTTDCTGFSTVSDAAGNFALTNLPLACTGPQLIGFNGTTATSPAGTYAGVNLVFTLSSGQVSMAGGPGQAAPFLVHLPQINNVETFMVTQNSSSNQSYAYATIPGLSVLVYAGTTFTLADGTQPNPFPLAAVQVPVDRLPDNKQNVPTMMRAFIVAFQPANATTNQPVAVYFPNTLSTAPGTDMALMTLDPTHGQMVPYGTGAVSADATQIVPDPDPAHPGHLYGLMHFDWHGPMPPTAPPNNPSPLCPTCQPQIGNYVDLSSGINVINAVDNVINGPLGQLSIDRTFRTMSTNPGPFGIGTGFNYGYELITESPLTLVMPDGNQYMFNVQQNGGYVNTTIPGLAGAVLSGSLGNYSLRWKNGTVWKFPTGARLAFLGAIIDTNGNTTTVTVTGSGEVTQVTDPVGRSLTLVYDGSGRITSITDPIGRVVRYTYNGAGYLATVTDPNGGVTTYSYNGQGQLTSIQDPRGVLTEQNTYDANGRVIQQVQADGGNYQFSYSVINPMAPESPVFLTVVTDPRGNQTTYRFGTFPYFTDAADPTGQTKSFVLDPAHNNLVRQIIGTALCSSCGDPTQGNQSFTRDSSGNILTSTDQLGNTTTFTYDSLFNNITSFTDPLGNKTQLTYDSHGNLLTLADANRNTTTFIYNSGGQVTQITDPTNAQTALGYDNFGNLVTITDALGNITSIIYDSVSRPIATVDALGRKSSITYDPLDRVISQTNPQNNTTGFAYDPVGNLLSLTDARGNTTMFTYDPMNRLQKRTTPLGKTESRAYDVNGNLISFTDRRGQISTFAYDPLNRLIGETYQDSTVTRAYDGNSRLNDVNDSAGGAFTFAYDAIGRLVDSTSPFGEVQYAYNAASRETQRQVIGQPVVDYAYDPVGNLLVASAAAVSVTLTYDPRNLLRTISRLNGVTSQDTYDSLGRLLSITHSGPGGLLSSLSYTYDPVGNRVSATNSAAQPLITQTVASATYDIDNKQNQFGSAANTFDANGNLISSTKSDGTTSYTFDSRNRLVASSAPDGQMTTLKYDFVGNLIQQNDAGPTVSLTQSFVLDNLTNVAFVSRSDGDQYSVLTGKLIDEDLVAVHTGMIEYSLADALNSTVATVDQAGAMKGRFFYEPFGQATGGESTYPFQYTGRNAVSQNLDYYRARFYNPMAARFLSEDPIGSNGQGVNYYAYVLNNPIGSRDPTGLRVEFPEGSFSDDDVPPSERDYYNRCICQYKHEPLVVSSIVAATSYFVPGFGPWIGYFIGVPLANYGTAWLIDRFCKNEAHDEVTKPWLGHHTVL